MKERSFYMIITCSRIPHQQIYLGKKAVHLCFMRNKIFELDEGTQIFSKNE